MESDESSSRAKELSREEISKLLGKKPRKQPAKRKKFDFADRTYDGWFKIPTKWGLCEVPGHDTSQDKPHPIYPDQMLNGRMIADIGNHSVCRYCYLDLKDIAAWGDGYWLL